MFEGFGGLFESQQISSNPIYLGRFSEFFWERHRWDATLIFSKAMKERVECIMKTVKVAGENRKHKVSVYALSTCIWCKLTKQFLNENRVEYEYVDVDLCSAEDRDAIRREITDRGGSFSFPTVIVDDKILITGFRKDRLKEVLEI